MYTIVVFYSSAVSSVHCGKQQNQDKNTDAPSLRWYLVKSILWWVFQRIKWFWSIPIWYYDSGIKNCFLPVTMVDKRFIVNKRYFKSNSIHKLEFRWELLIWLRFKSRVRNWKRKRLMWVRVLNFNFIYWIFVHIIDRSFQIVTLWFVAQMRPTNWFPIFQFIDNDRKS